MFDKHLCSISAARKNPAFGCLSEDSVLQGTETCHGIFCDMAFLLFEILTEGFRTLVNDKQQTRQSNWFVLLTDLTLPYGSSLRTALSGIYDQANNTLILFCQYKIKRVKINTELKGF